LLVVAATVAKLKRIAERRLFAALCLRISDGTAEISASAG
jgi:hypothetical protein